MEIPLDHAEVARSMYESFNERDFERIMRYVDHSLEWLDMATSQTFRGPEGFKNLFQRWISEYSDATIEITGLACAGTRCMVQFTGRGRRLRPVLDRPGQFEPVGIPLQLRFCHVLEFANGKLARGHSYQEACTANRIYIHRTAHAAQLAPRTRLRAESTQAGSTPNFVVQFDSNAPNGAALAAGVLANCERDYATLQGWFNNIGVSSLPFHVTIQAGNNGASHKNCGSTDIECDAFNGTDSNLVSAVLVAEVTEVLESNQGGGWDCGASNGEALSRVLAAEIYPNELSTQGISFATGSNWLGSSRPNWVDQTEGSDTEFVSIGCGTLFINYLCYQRDIGLKAIVVAGGSTLEKGFEKLTGNNGAFGPFSRLLARFFPGTQSNIANDNPFPLIFADHFYTTSAVERDAAVHPSAVKMFRMFSPNSGDHFYTTSADERDNAFVDHGYRFEGTAFSIFPDIQPNRVPLFRLFNPTSGDHFYTTSEPERNTAITQDGYLSEGRAGFVFAAQQPDTTPVFRLYNAGNGDHFYTTSEAERDNAVANDGYDNEGIACFVYSFASYSNEGVACHVFPNQAANTQPLFRLRSSTTIDHFYTMSAAERAAAINQNGYIDEGVACFAFPNAVGGSVPLFRVFNPQSGDHFYTTSAVERDNAVANLGYQNEGTAAQVLAQPDTGTTPLLRLLGTAQAWA
jgi:hypothetical protein